MTILPRDERWFAPGATLWSGSTAFVVAESQPYRQQGLTVRFEGIADRVAAEALRGTELEVEAADRPELGEGEFWPEDLIGLEAEGPSGEPLGAVVAVVFGPQDRLVVETPGGRRVEVPFVSALVGDPVDGRIRIDPPGGMFDE